LINIIPIVKAWQTQGKKEVELPTHQFPLLFPNPINLRHSCFAYLGTIDVAFWVTRLFPSDVQGRQGSSSYCVLFCPLDSLSLWILHIELVSACKITSVVSYSYLHV
jgi:hypothetical protein